MTRRPVGEEELIAQRVMRLNAAASAAGMGSLCGLGLFLATLFLALKGGPWTGEHLQLLGQYLPGYTVSIGGAFLGLVYGVVLGGFAGYFVASVYNRVAR